LSRFARSRRPIGMHPCSTGPPLDKISEQTHD
jgi:hypothetical protein